MAFLSDYRQQLISLADGGNHYFQKPIDPLNLRAQSSDRNRLLRKLTMLLKNSIPSWKTTATDYTP